MAGAPTDHLANERTFLAWVRTAITVMAFGFVVARFGLFLREGGGGTSAPASPVSDAIGVLLVLAGTAVLATALVRFHRARAELLAGRFSPGFEAEWVLAGLLVAVGIGLAVYLLGLAG